MDDTRGAARDTEDARDALVARARALVPDLASRAAATERDRAVPRATHEAFLAAGLYRAQQPARYGGLECDPSIMVALAGEVGRGCGSSAWVLSNLSVQSWFVGMMEPQAQADVWGANPEALIAGSFPARGGTARLVDGGVVVDGLWSFSSGVDFADWNNVQVFLPKDEGLPEHRFALVPMEDVEVVDDWFPTGLAGTGSRSLRLKEVFIPEHRSLATTRVMGQMTPGNAVNPSPVYRIPPMSVGAKVFTGPALGIARGALETVEEMITGRLNVAGARMAELPTAQIRVAEASAELAAAEALLLKDCADALRMANAGELPDIARRAQWRLNNAFAGQLCLRAVQRLHPLMGARGLDFDHPYNRAARDIHAAVQQITMSWDIQTVNAGRVRFGLPPQDPRL